MVAFLYFLFSPICWQVEILVDDGIDSGAVEAGTLGTVTASAALYDPNVVSANGCDPSGCTAALTRVRN